ncbi:MAG: sulfatase-like hydrolase/transferase, partial [Verrucomicrobiales bacterium]|nr:sulfatase-like hydrolase/transferase [Verrucomicrobiales bacterium]
MKWFGLYLVAALGVVPALVPAAEPPKPNIVVVLADDLGWTDAGFAGSRFYETPNLDALAAGGARFTSFYASSVGLPTRASLWSGQYPSRTSVYAGDVGEPPVPAPETVPPPAEGTSLAAVLKSVGYATGFVGTWGPGPDGGAGPARHGFDEAVIVSPRHLGFEVVPSAEIPAGAHHVDYVTDRGLEFMDRHREKPFLLVLS